MSEDRGAGSDAGGTRGSGRRGSGAEDRSGPGLAPDRDHWLVRPSTIRTLWWVFGATLAVTVAWEIPVEGHPHFGIDGVFAFYAWYGFGTCVAMVLLAKGLGIFVKRGDDYYDG